MDFVLEWVRGLAPESLVGGGRIAQRDESSPCLGEDVDGAGDYQTDDDEGDDRLQGHRQLGPSLHWHYVRGAERRARRQPEDQVVDVYRPPVGRREFGTELLRKRKVRVRALVQVPRERATA